MKFEYEIDVDEIKDDFFDDIIKTEKTEKMFDDTIQKIFTPVITNTGELIMDILHREISKYLDTLRQDIKNKSTIKSNPDCKRLVDFLNRQVNETECLVFSINEFYVLFNIRPPLSEEIINVLNDVYWDVHFNDNGSICFDRM